MEAIELILNHWPAIAGTASVLSTLAVLWLTANFPRRREFETLKARIEMREKGAARLEQRIEKIEGTLEKVGSQMDEMGHGVTKLAAQTESMHFLIREANEKNHWRMNALENQVTILLRGHLEWEDK